MKLKKLIAHSIVIVSPEITLQRCSELMRTHDVGALPVCQHGRFVGMIVDQDFASKSAVEGGDAPEETVESVMTTEVPFCYEDDDSADAESTMRTRALRRLAVLNREHCLVGMVSLDDLARP